MINNQSLPKKNKYKTLNSAMNTIILLLYQKLG